jgi:PTS system mannose-specific IIC component
MTAASSQADFANLIPGWLTTVFSTFGGMMAALGMGIILSFLLKKKWYIVFFLLGFVLVTYFNLSTMGVAVVATLLAVIYFFFASEKTEGAY